MSRHVCQRRRRRHRRRPTHRTRRHPTRRPTRRRRRHRRRRFRRHRRQHPSRRLRQHPSRRLTRPAHPPLSSLHHGRPARFRHRPLQPVNRQLIQQQKPRQKSRQHQTQQNHQQRRTPRFSRRHCHPPPRTQPRRFRARRFRARRSLPGTQKHSSRKQPLHGPIPLRHRHPPRIRRHLIRHISRHLCPHPPQVRPHQHRPHNSPHLTRLAHQPGRPHVSACQSLRVAVMSRHRQLLSATPQMLWAAKPHHRCHLLSHAPF